MFVIFDLDGTLCDISHRTHFVADGRKKWKDFFEACVDDVPNQPVIDTLLAHAAAGNRVEIWSGRSDMVLEQTREWLRQNGAIDSYLTRMRPKKSYERDDALKERWLLAEPEKPALVYDDRQRVVDMWRRHGIVCAQVAQWDEPKRHSGRR